MRRLFLTITMVLFLITARTAIAAPRVIVVDVKGDIDDPDAIRDAVGKELGATAIAPEDPRAAQAKGTLVIELKGTDRRMSATYRRLGDPVSRTVDLPADPRRARQFAVVLAGNVAREEADELLGTMKKPAQQPPPPTPAPPTPADALGAGSESDVRRARAILDHHSGLARDRRYWAAGAAFAQAGFYLGFGTYYASRTGEDASGERNVGRFLLSHGVGSVAAGVLLLAITGDPHEVLALRLRDLERSSSPEHALTTLDREWAEAADQARSNRKVLGAIAVGVGSLGILTGVALPSFVAKPDDATTTATMAFVLLGGLTVSLGIHAFFSPSEVESSYTLYRSMRAGGEPSYGAWSAGRQRASIARPRPTIGAAPLPGGGGSVSFGMVF